MHKVFFKTSEPTAVPGKVEFYNLSLSLEDIRGRQISFVHQTHGVWSNETGTAWLEGESKRPPEVFESLGEALGRFRALQSYLAWCGFKHSFSWNPQTGFPTNYEPVEVPIDLSCVPSGRSSAHA
jgi:hypothetical protein